MIYIRKSTWPRRRVLFYSTTFIPQLPFTKFSASDVVFFLDDEPLALAQFRLSWGTWRSYNHFVCLIWIRRCRYCRYLYHVCHVIHHQRVLGMSILDSFGARFEVCFLSSFRSLIFMSNTKQFSWTCCRVPWSSPGTLDHSWWQPSTCILAIFFRA